MTDLATHRHCPICGASPGNQCTNNNGTTRHVTHPGRFHDPILRRFTVELVETYEVTATSIEHALDLLDDEDLSSLHPIREFTRLYPVGKPTDAYETDVE